MVECKFSLEDTCAYIRYHLIYAQVPVGGSVDFKINKDYDITINKEPDTTDF